MSERERLPDTLATLDLNERPGQKITYFRHVRHFQEDGRVDLPPGAHVFSCGPHHEFYCYTVASNVDPHEEDF